MHGYYRVDDLLFGTSRLWQDAENRTVLANILKKNLGQVPFKPFYLRLLFIYFCTIRPRKTLIQLS